MSGARQGLDLVVRSLVDPGDRVVLEEMHYDGARELCRATGPRRVHRRRTSGAARAGGDRAEPAAAERAHRRLAKRNGGRITAQGQEADLHVLVWFETLTHQQFDTVRRRAAGRGIRMGDLEPFCVRPPRRPGALFFYGALDEHEIVEGVCELRRVVDSVQQ